MKSFQTETEIILASKSKVRKNILEKNNIKCKVVASNVDEDIIKKLQESESEVKKQLFQESVS